MSEHQQRPGRTSRYLSGGVSALLRGRAQPGDEAATWTREELLRMDDRFVVAVEAAIRLGVENRASASACERPGAGDGDRLALAS